MSLSAEVISVIAEQVAAAKHDWDTADPGDVGLNGIIIKQWREGYFEGCKDMAQVIVGRLPEDLQKIVGEKITAIYKEELEKLKELTASPQQHTTKEG